MTTMKLKINGEYVSEYKDGVDIAEVRIREIKQNELNDKTKKIFKNGVIPVAVACGYTNISRSVLLATSEEIAKNINLADRVMPLIHMLQEFALPVSIGVATWGLVEIIMGNYNSGKTKLKHAIIGFAGIFFIPEVFFSIRNAFLLKE